MPGVGGLNQNPNPTNLNSPVNPNRPTIESGQVRPGVQVQRPPASGAEAPPKTPAPAPAPTISIKLMSAHFKEVLVKLGFPPEFADQVEQAFHSGVVPSKENIASLLANAPKGSTAAQKEAAVIALLKGLEQLPSALQILSSYLGKNASLVKLLEQFMQNKEALSNMLAKGGVMDSSLSSKLSALLASLGEEFMSLNEKISGKKDGKFSSKELLGSLRSAKSLLEGLGQKLNEQPDSPQKQDLLSKLFETSKQLQEMTENMVAQAIISKPREQVDQALPDQFAYWKIPNMMGNPPKDIELLIKRDANHKNEINPENTKIVLKLETPTLGEIGIELNIQDKNMQMQFSIPDDESRKTIAAHSEDLKKQMESRNFNLNQFNVQAKTLDTKPLLFPKIDLDILKRVQSEV